MFAWAAVASATTGAELGAVMDRCRPGSHAPLPTLDAAQLDTIAAGRVLQLLHHADPDAPSTAVGVALLEGSLESLWIAAQDPHAVVDPNLKEFVVRQLGPDHASWYGHLDLPRQLVDRQWVVTSQNNHGLAERSGGTCWEHHWDLAAEELAAAREAIAAGARADLTTDDWDAALATPMNQGSWSMARVDRDHTLVAYQATTVVGGAVPDWLVAQLAKARLEEVMRSLESRAATWVPGHYGSRHAPLLGADGAPIAPGAE